MITIDQLHKIMPKSSHRADVYLGPLNTAMEEFHIDTFLRCAAFLAQIAHESGELWFTKEIATGKAYEGRRDLGNTQDGDGQRYKGRGLIQITVRYNYRKCGIALNVDFEQTPELLEGRVNACRSAAWWWKYHGLNELADDCEFRAITRRINGGYSGEEKRQAYYDVALKVMASG